MTGLISDFPGLARDAMNTCRVFVNICSGHNLSRSGSATTRPRGRGRRSRNVHKYRANNLGKIVRFDIGPQEQRKLEKARLLEVLSSVTFPELPRTD